MEMHTGQRQVRQAIKVFQQMYCPLLSAVIGFEYVSHVRKKHWSYLVILFLEEGDGKKNGHRFSQESVEFDVQADERGRPHATALKPVVGRKPSDCPLFKRIGDLGVAWVPVEVFCMSNELINYISYMFMKWTWIAFDVSVFAHIPRKKELSIAAIQSPGQVV